MRREDVRRTKIFAWSQQHNRNDPPLQPGVGARGTKGCCQHVGGTFGTRGLHHRQRLAPQLCGQEVSAAERQAREARIGAEEPSERQRQPQRRDALDDRLQLNVGGPRTRLRRQCEISEISAIEVAAARRSYAATHPPELSRGVRARPAAAST